ncbi:hypothetical protein GCM10023331_24560 [Algivirga pacifica]|uniref:Tetratricopeptide repeat-containing protein n=2 Tax=Algivirga pacifica TaxID=1162670 RepID=A0ABP9DBQ3_9BACT
MACEKQSKQEKQHHTEVLPASEGEMPITASSQAALEIFENGRSLFELVQLVEARYFFKEAIETDSSFALAYLYTAWCSPSKEEALFYVNKAMNLREKVTESEGMMIEASYWGYHGEYKKSIECWEKLSERIPKDKRILNSLAYAYFQTKDYKRSIETLHKSIAIDSVYTLNYNALGYSYQYQGHIASAEKAFRKYAALLPNTAKPFDTLGDFYRKTGQLDKAIKAYEQAIVLNDKFDHAQHKIAQCMLFQGRYTEARVVLNSALSMTREPYNIVWHLKAIGDSYLYENKYDKALKGLSDAKAKAEELGLKGTSADILLDMALICIFRGEMLQAKEYIEVVDEHIEGHQVDAAMELDLKMKQFQCRILATAIQKEYEETDRLLKQYTYEVSLYSNDEWSNRLKQLEAYVRMRKTMYQEAKTSLGTADQQDVLTIYLYARIAEEEGDIPLANRYYQQVIDWNDADTTWYALIRSYAVIKLGES